MFFHAPVFQLDSFLLAASRSLSGLRAYDTQRSRAIHQGMANAPEQLAINRGPDAYLDFINMFLFCCSSLAGAGRRFNLKF